MSDLPRILVSRCLLGDHVRYDGGHKKSAALSAHIRPHHTIIGVCPEVEAGMGTPRPPIDLVEIDGGLTVVDRTNDHDWTAPLTVVAQRLIRADPDQVFDGCIWKSGSPSCGLESTPRYVEQGQRQGTDGLVAGALREHLNALPMIDERGLLDEEARSIFELGVIVHFLRRTGRPWPKTPWAVIIRDEVCEDGTSASSGEERIPHIPWSVLALGLERIPLEIRKVCATSARDDHRTIGAVIAGTRVPLKSER